MTSSTEVLTSFPSSSYGGNIGNNGDENTNVEISMMMLSLSSSPNVPTYHTDDADAGHNHHTDEKPVIDAHDLTTTNDDDCADDGDDVDNFHQDASTTTTTTVSVSQQPKASETYLESSPIFRDRKQKMMMMKETMKPTSISNLDDTADEAIDDSPKIDSKDGGDNLDPANDSSNNVGVVPPSSSYKNGVYEMMQRIEQANERLLQEQESKSIDFRRRMDQMLGSYGDNNNNEGNDSYHETQKVNESLSNANTVVKTIKDMSTTTATTKAYSGGGSSNSTDGTVTTAATSSTNGQHSTFLQERCVPLLSTNQSHDSSFDVDTVEEDVDDDDGHNDGHHHNGDSYYYNNYHDRYHQQQPRQQALHDGSGPPHRVVIGNLPLLDEDRPLIEEDDVMAKTKESLSSRVDKVVVSTASNDVMDRGHVRTSTDHVATSTATTTTSKLLQKPPSSSYTSIFVLQSELDRVRLQTSRMQMENNALSALRSSYQNRVVREVDYSRSLEQKVYMLERKVNELLVSNEEQEHQTEKYKKESRTGRMALLSQEATLKHKNQRVRRDLDKLWKQYKVSQRRNEESQRTIEELQQQLKEYERKEQKWQKERSYMKEKLSFMKSKTNKLTDSLQQARQEHSTIVADLNSRLQQLEQKQS